MTKVLFIGESWFTYSVHQKGFDVFHTSEYVEGGTDFIRKLIDMGMEVDYVPAHKIDNEVPNSADGYKKYDVVIISDVGANSFLLGKETFTESKIGPNKLEAMRSYVANGGGLLMIGGYMSFTGIDAKARYGESPLKDCLPVKMLSYDDRVEVPQGITPKKTGEHSITKELNKHWPNLLGYNRVVAKENTNTLAVVGENPLLVISKYKKGKSAVFTSDLAPHWATPEFVNWEGYISLWGKIIGWLSPKV